MNTIGIALVWCVVQITLLGILAAGLYLLVRRLRPAAGAPVVLTGMVMVAVLSLLALSPWPRWRLTSTSPSPNQSTATVASPSAPRPLGEGQGVREPAERAIDSTGPGTSAEREADTIHPSVLATLWQMFAEQLSQPQPLQQATTWHWPAAVAMLLLAAMTCGLGWLLLGIVAVRRQRMRSSPVMDRALLELVDALRAELGCQRPVEIRQSDDLATAATIGWRRPVVLLPADWTAWTPEQRRAVLAHEIAHARSHDFLALLFGQLGLMLHCYHPLLHWLMSRLRLEQELAADAAAASVSGGQWQYLTTIAELALRQQDRPLLWPARTFLPTRTTFLRRISMLRDAKLSVRRLSPLMRTTAIGAALLCGLFVAGLRGPGSQPQARAAEVPPVAPASPTAVGTVAEAPPANPVASTAVGDQEGIDWSFVPTSAVAVAAARPAAIFPRPELAEFESMLGRIWVRFKLKANELTQTTFVLLELPPVPDTPRQARQPLPDSLLPDVLFIHQVTRPDLRTTFLRSIMDSSPTEHEYHDKTYFCTNEKEPPQARTYYVELGDRTVVVGSMEKTIKQLIDAQAAGDGSLGRPKFIDAQEWKAFQADQAVVAVSAKAFGTFVKLQEWQAGKPTPFLKPFAPLWQETTQGLAGIRFGKDIQVHAVLMAQNAEAAEKVEKTIDGARMLAQFGLDAIAMQPPQVSVQKFVSDVLNWFANEMQIKREGTLVSLGGTVNMAVLAHMLPEANAAREAGRRAHTMNNLKQLALAMLNYEARHQRLPPAVLYGPDGKTPYSWRVELLPYLGHTDLHGQYHFDEPWDGPNNRKLLEKTPGEFRSADDPHAAQNASYFVLTGPGTLFDGRRGTAFNEVRDSLHNTIMVVEASRDIPWTKPEDIPYDAHKALPQLGGYLDGRFGVAMADGTASTLPNTVDEKILRALVTKAGGEVVTLEDALREPLPPGVQPAQPGQVRPPSPPATPAP